MKKRKIEKIREKNCKFKKEKTIDKKEREKENGESKNKEREKIITQRY